MYDNNEGVRCLNLWVLTFIKRLVVRLDIDIFVIFRRCIHTKFNKSGVVMLHVSVTFMRYALEGVYMIKYYEETALRVFT